VNTMEIEIESKRNNPLFNRTEVHFTVRHEGKGTPDRELIRSELAEKLNAKKENIVVHTIHSSFGNQESTGYAKVYTSVEKSKGWERQHILRRNKIIAKEEKKPGEAPAEPKEKEKTEKPTEEPPKVEEQPTEEAPKTEEEKPVEEQPAELPKKEAAEESKEKEKPAEEKKE
jgi:ribosomal protein S24E